MAGGVGTRFWPLSRQTIPKQLLNLSGKESMINEAIDRLSYTIDKKDIFVVTNIGQKKLMLEATKGRIIPDHILSEPSSRNTAACIGYAAMEIIKKYGNGIMVITPSDAYIRDIDKFTKVLNEAIKAVECQDKLITIGITPTFPATGYGYIKYNKTLSSQVKTVTEFKEKPNKKTAEKYIKEGTYTWNSGMFIWKASTILEKFLQFIPDIYNDLCKIGEAMGGDDEFNVINQLYPCIREISVDYGIMEPSARNGDVLVIPGEFGWNDVGSWDMMNVLHESDTYGNVILGDGIAINTTDSTIYSSKRLVTAVGVNNLVIVETEDAVMVCDKNSAQEVKLIVDMLYTRGRKEFL